MYKRQVLEVHGIPDGLLADLVGEVRAAVPGVRFGLEPVSYTHLTLPTSDLV